MAKLNRTEAFSSILSSAKAGPQSGERQLPLEDIHLNPEQPRKFFGEEGLEALTASVREKGVLQPVLVREHGDAYELVAGERRYRAAERAGLETIPAVIRDMSDAEALEIALIENLQREDLNPVEETDATLTLLSLKLDAPVQDVLEAVRQSHYRALGRVDNTGVNNPHVEVVESLLETIGRYSVSSFYNHRVPLLKLPADLLEAVRSGQLEYSKARLLNGLKDQKQRAKLLTQAVEENLSREQLKTEINALKNRTASTDVEASGGDDSVDVGRLKRKLTTSRINKLPSTKQRELNKLLLKLDTLLQD